MGSEKYNTFPPLLKEAAEYAAISGDDMRIFLLGAIAVRADGAIVHARNGAMRMEHDRKNYRSIGHAESRVLQKAGNGATLYVARMLRDGTYGMAKPCVTCQALCRFKKVAKVIYSIDNESYGVWLPMKGHV